MSEAEQLAGEGVVPHKTARKLDFPIVGVGASAGGLAAFKALLRGLRRETPAAFVLVQHLDPTHDSHLCSILKKHTAFEVLEVSAETDVKPRHIYVISPGSEITIRDGVLRVAAPRMPRGRRAPIDVFLRSLAEDHAELAVGVLLSGTGADGTLGLAEIKAHGGMTLVQDPAEAEFPGMPASAVAHRCVDFVLPASEIPRRIDVFFDHIFAHVAAAAPALEEQEKLILRILSAIRSRQGHDFRHYKRNTIVRRIQRRMGLRQVQDMDAYLELLREDPDEVRDLAQDLLISVTSFFRNADLWSAMEEEVIPAVLDRMPDGQVVRFWVPGCATGEEAYSYAMLLTEAIDRAGRSLKVQVYATDVDERAREIARRGVYPASIASDIGQERLRRFFSAQGDAHYQVSKQLRDQVVFARHDLLSDPPFSRMDLVSCRNLLIYLSRAAQEKVLQLLHFALNPRGVLVLGSAETLGKQTHLFTPMMQELRIFHRHGDRHAGNLEIPAAPRMPIGDRPLRESRQGSADLEALTRTLLMRHLVTGAVLVDESLQLLYVRGRTAPYLEQPEGAPSNDLLTLAAQGLKPRLRRACQRVLCEGVETRFECPMPGEGGRRGELAGVTVQPVELSGARGGIFIIFEKIERSSDAPESARRDGSASDALVRELEAELRTTREQLHGAVEDLETSNEELRASNEEILSMNEELQTSNEELETSKEELQSLNEELTTLNAQLEEKVGDLEHSNNDLINLLASTHIAVLFLDHELRIQRYTSASAQLFNLIASDIGRPISDLAGKLDDVDLLESARKVLEDLQPREQQIEAKDGSVYLRRILPYRTQDNRIEGVVVVLNDITGLQQATTALARSEERFRDLADNISQLVWMASPSGEIFWFNQRWLEFTGTSAEEGSGRDWSRLLHPDQRDGVLEKYKAYLEGLQPWEDTFMLRRHDGVYRWFLSRAFPIREEGGQIVRWFGSNTDITEHIRQEEELRRTRDAAQAANRAKAAFLANMSHDIRTPLTAILGYSEVIKKLLSPENQRLARLIKESSDQLIETLESVLNLSRLEGDGENMNITPMPLADEVAKAYRMFVESRSNRAVEFEREPDGEKPVWCLADRSALYRVLGNLLSNAIKFSSDEQRIWIRINRDERWAILSIRDEGQGISAEFMPRIFDAFSQERGKLKSSLSGSGLGLTITKQLVELMGGRIAVESEVGAGTTAKVYLPLAKEPETVEPNPVKVHRPSMPRMRILVCEDYEPTQTIVQHLLSDHDLTLVSTAEELLADEGGHDVILLDVNLQGEDVGYLLMCKLRESGRHAGTRIIAFTAHNLPGQREEFVEMGFDDFLPKPFREEDLIRAILPPRERGKVPEEEEAIE